MSSSSRVAFLIVLALLAVLIVCLLPPVRQDPGYHQFADGSRILGIPNFWNVISNVPFLLVALWGLTALTRRESFAEAWEQHAYLVLLIGVALVAFGSGYYHLHPSDATLFWDRLPMAIVFMALLATTIGERVSSQAGRLLLVPLLAIGALSLLVWRLTGDLRVYGLVQFFPMLALPMLLILFPSLYTRTAGLWGMIASYAVAKAFELEDQRIWNAAAPVSGHPLKHLAGAIAMLCYVQTVRRRHRRK